MLRRIQEIRLDRIRRKLNNNSYWKVITKKAKDIKPHFNVGETIGKFDRNTEENTIKVMSRSETAAFLGVKEEDIKFLIKSRKLPQHGKNYFIYNEVVAWLLKRYGNKKIA